MKNKYVFGGFIIIIFVGLMGYLVTQSNIKYEDNINKIKTEIEKFIPPSGELVFHFSICKINEICSCGANIGGGYIPTSGGPNCPTDKDIYSDEVSVSVTLDSGSVDPKVLRLFVWEK